MTYEDYINSLTSPGEFGSIGGFLAMLINLVLGIGVGLSLIMIVVSGIKFVTSKGDPKELDSAKSSLLYSILAFILVIGAVAIKNAIYDLFGFSLKDVPDF